MENQVFKFGIINFEKSYGIIERFQNFSIDMRI